MLMAELWRGVEWLRRRCFGEAQGLWVREVDVALLAGLLAWCLEWAIVVEYVLGEYYRTFIVFPIRIPLLLIVCIVYWCFTWGMVGWRRSQFGRFTRGDRRLWAKGYAAFWVVEFVTVISFILVYFWLSWGPLPVVGRMIIFPRRGLLLEFIMYSYLMFLAYAARLAIKWNLYAHQYRIALGVVIIFSWLLWRDVSMLFTREPFLAHVGTHWRKATLGALVYTLSNEWWLQHILGSRHPWTLYPSLLFLLQAQDAALRVPAVPINYVAVQRLVRQSFEFQVGGALPRLRGRAAYDPALSVLAQHSWFYPTRVGFVPKRMAMWQLLTVLKMWHHLVILLWWVLYITRLAARRRNAYAFAAVCYFNIYCCYLLGLLVYSLYYAARWEIYMRVRPTNFSWHRHILLVERALAYLGRGARAGTVGAALEIYGVAPHL